MMRKKYALWEMQHGSKHTTREASDDYSNMSFELPSAENPVKFFEAVILRLNLSSSPLFLAFYNPVEFFETYWPSLRFGLQRLSYTLKFETPLRLQLDMDYQFVFEQDDRSSTFL